MGFIEIKKQYGNHLAIAFKKDIDQAIHVGDLLLNITPKNDVIDPMSKGEQLNEYIQDYTSTSKVKLGNFIRNTISHPYNNQNTDNLCTNEAHQQHNKIMNEFYEQRESTVKTSLASFDLLTKVYAEIFKLESNFENKKPTAIIK